MGWCLSEGLSEGCSGAARDTPCLIPSRGSSSRYVRTSERISVEIRQKLKDMKGREQFSIAVVS